MASINFVAVVVHSFNTYSYGMYLQEQGVNCVMCLFIVFGEVVPAHTMKAHGKQMYNPSFLTTALDGGEW